MELKFTTCTDIIFLSLKLAISNIDENETNLFLQIFVVNPAWFQTGSQGQMHVLNPFTHVD